ncbi:MAG: SpoIIE family protein phosphatase [Acidobacteriota bacterium]|nr:SpoIIE family protein phosphatase [Acidobacteriota bacterium]
MSTSAHIPANDSLRRDLSRQQQRLRTAVGAREDARLTQLLAEVDQALARIDEGSYGICVNCHESIGETTLAAYPLIGYCIDHLSEPERRHLEDDLQLAARVQSRLLPEPGLRTAGWEVAYRYEPMGPVGGDYCDLIRANGDGFFFFLGDVSGKGVAASLLAAQLHGLFRTLVALDLPLETMVERANQIFCESVLTGHFATLVCGHASASGVLDFINAGHPSPLLVSEGRATPLEAGGHPLGMFCEGDYRAERIDVSLRQQLLLYTDGLSEAAAPSSEEYGSTRAARVAAGRHTDAEALVAACLADVAAFRASAPRTDDLTVMALQRTG